MAEEEEINLYFFLELAAAFFVGFILVNIAISYSKGTVYEKLNIAEDIAMQINTISSLPGDAYLIDKNMHGYSLYFNGNKIEIYDIESDPTKGVYYFSQVGNLNIDTRLDKPKQVIVSKINGQIKISEEIPNLS